MILALETSTTICSVAIVENQTVIAQKLIDEKNIHSEKLLSFIDELLLEAKLNLSNFKAIAVSAGPGSFTGLRIGMSIAKGICFAKDIPLILVPTLDAIANEFIRLKNPTSATTICTIIDAKRDEAYFSFYKIENGSFTRLNRYEIKERIHIFEEMKSKNASFLVGDGVEKFLTFDQQNFIILNDVKLNAISVGLMAEKNFEPTEILNAEPIYIRSFQPK